MTKFFKKIKPLLTDMDLYKNQGWTFYLIVLKKNIRRKI